MRRAFLAASAALLISLAGCATTGSHAMTADSGKPRMLINRDAGGLAIQGYDPVAYFTDSKPVKGDMRYRSERGGATYQFASAEHQAAFEADPEKYTPQFGGYCAYAASIKKVSPISPEFWEIVNGRLILQHNKKAWDLWHKDPANNLVRADANWPGLVERHGK